MKKKAPKSEHVGFRNQNMFCHHCGGEQVINYPVQVEMVTAIMTAFEKIHHNCKPGWKEPQANQLQSIHERADWWMSRGETGMSSKTIWAHMRGIPLRPQDINIPWDPDDFKRCYKLLKAIPEWRLQIHKMKSLSPEWERLADNWDKLTEMYEQNEREQWKNYKQIDMYGFMCALTRPEKVV